MNYELDWRNPDIWEHNGMLQYDSANGVLRFINNSDSRNQTPDGQGEYTAALGKGNADAWCSTVIPIPQDNSNCYSFSFTAGNSSPASDSEAGLLELRFYDASDNMVQHIDTGLIMGKESFCRYYAMGTEAPEDNVVIPKDATKMEISVYAGSAQKEINFYFKDFEINFNRISEIASEDYIPDGFRLVRVDKTPIRISDNSIKSNLFLFAAIIIGGVSIFIRLMKKDGLIKEKEDEDGSDNNNL